MNNTQRNVLSLGFAKASKAKSPKMPCSFLSTKESYNAFDMALQKFNKDCDIIDRLSDSLWISNAGSFDEMFI